MDSDLKLLCDGSRSFQMLHMFNKSVGKLQGLLCKGEYTLLKHLLIFESDFIHNLLKTCYMLSAQRVFSDISSRINKRGEVIDVHNSVQMVTVGIAYTSQNLTIPDIMLLAQPAVSYAVSARNDQDTQGKGFKSTKSLELTSVASFEVYAKEDLFACWEDLVYLRRPPVEAYSGTLAQPAGDIISIPVLEGENKKKPAAMELHREGDQDRLSIQSLPMVADVSPATSVAYTGGEGVQQHGSHIHCVLRNTQSFLIPAPTGPDCLAAPGALVTLRGSSVVSGGQTISRPVTETTEGLKVEAFMSALQREGDVSRVSQLQAEASGQRKEKEQAPTQRPDHLSRVGEDSSSLSSHRTTWGEKTEEQSTLQGQGHGSPLNIPGSAPP
ncbi:protein FAM71A [Prionailurus iriomotensis]